MDDLPGTQFTNAWMANPWMFDPSQKSNKFSLFNDNRLPFPPTYSGVPTDAMGRPIQSFVDWQRQNPAGTTINNTPAQPAQSPQPQQPWTATPRYGGVNPGGQGSGFGSVYQGLDLQPPRNWQQQPAPAAPAASQQQGAGAPPNNWGAALSALANPGNPTTPGATVPLAQTSQPAGGVNQAWLQGIGSGAGMNQNFVNALRNIQGR